MIALMLPVVAVLDQQLGLAKQQPGAARVAGSERRRRQVDLPTAEAEAFLDQLSQAANDGKITPILKKWLSAEDFKALDEEYPTMRKVRPVFFAITSYYEGIWGKVGEDTASES